MKTPKELAPEAAQYVSASWIRKAYGVNETIVDRAWKRGKIKIAAYYYPGGSQCERPLFTIEEAHRWARERYLAAKVAEEEDRET